MARLDKHRIMTRREVLLTAAGLGAALNGARSEGVMASGGAQSPAGPQTPPLVSLEDYEGAARQHLSRMAYEYVAGGAADEVTLRRNREAFNDIRLHPRALVDVSKLDTRVMLFGQELPHPILLAPTAYHKLMHREGELATVRGAADADCTMVISSFATTAVEDIARAARGPLWFQLYVNPDRGFTRELVQRAEAAGCRALCVTVDTPVVGTRNRETRTGFALPPGMERENLKRLSATQRGGTHNPAESAIYSAILDPALTWKDIDWLRSIAKVPVLVKGVLSPEDALLAVKSGVGGIIVSNHGARNLDTVPATIEALPGIVEKVGGAVPILMDSGIRRGTDVLKALALGANAVLIGRPYLYGLGVAGADGVSAIVRILRTEFAMAMALTGRTAIARIDRSVIWP